MTQEEIIPKQEAHQIVTTGLYIFGAELLKLIHFHCQFDCDKQECSPDCRLYTIEKKFREHAAKTQTPEAQESEIIINDDWDIILGHNLLKSP